MRCCIVKKIEVVLVILLFLLFLLPSCKNEDSSRQQAYQMGVEHTFGSSTIKLSDDKENERFVLEYKTSEQGNNTYFFSFELNISTSESLSNSDQFEYSDNLGSNIIFDKNGYYAFYTSRTFYISYKNANESVKNIILSKQYISISTLSKTFYT